VICCSEGKFDRRFRIHIIEAEKCWKDNTKPWKVDAKVSRNDAEAEEASTGDAEGQEANTEASRADPRLNR